MDKIVKGKRYPSIKSIVSIPAQQQGRPGSSRAALWFCSRSGVSAAPPAP
ncbi:hypothetical protein HMPREF3038_02809 [Akkermansia sp. KLE1797]|nr:hypothetical protein HMPREF3038_02809 [Akkermansia sp. KLE1797]KZA04148.1 hypothetical protein HMPREF1326_02346 [Akkermansia sp. KLE1605]